MTAQHTTASFIPATEVAELYHDVLTVIVHDLGGIASALALRADALRPVAPLSDVEALHGLCAQTRDIMRSLRLLQGPRGESLVSPSRQTPVEEWWRLTSRLLSATLARAVRPNATLPAVTLNPATSSLMTNLLMLASRDLTARGVQGPAVLQVTVDHSESAKELAVTLELPLEQWRVPSCPVRRWERHAERLVKHGRADLQWWQVDADVARWRCVLVAP